MDSSLLEAYDNVAKQSECSLQYRDYISEPVHMRHERDRRKSYEMLFPMEIPCGWPGPGCVEAGGTVSTEAGAQHRHPRPDEEAAEMMGAVSPRRRGLQHTRGTARMAGTGDTLAGQQGASGHYRGHLRGPYWGPYRGHSLQFWVGNTAGTKGSERTLQDTLTFTDIIIRLCR